MKKINVLSLFDGISTGFYSLIQAGFEVENYYASEIEKQSIQISKYHYPNIIQLGDVNNWRNWNIDWSKIDLLIGGSPCFIAGTLVMTNEGMKPIEDIRVGDMVLTHKSRYKKVLKVGNRAVNELLRLKGMGFHELYTTREHPFYSREMYREYNKIKKNPERKFKEPTWTHAEKLNKSHYLGSTFNLSMNSSVIGDIKDENFWYFVGRFVGDGWTYKTKRKNRKNSYIYRVTLCCGKEEYEEVKQIMDHLKYSYYLSEERTAYKFHICNQKLHEFLSKCGHGASNKRVHPDLWNLNIKYKKAFLKGYLSADGYFCPKRNKYKVTCTSQILVYELKQLVIEVFKRHSTIYKSIKSKSYVIEGRKVNQRDCYSIEFTEDYRKQDHAFEDNNIVWQPFKTIDVIKENAVVYNLEVEDDNSYTANSMIVHNCQGFSYSGKRLNFDDPRSALFFTFVEILNHIRKYNPDVKFLLENVKMKPEWEKTITSYMGVEPALINSSLVSAQNRNRLYWANWEISQPEDRNITWGDIREHGVNEYYYTEKALQWLARHSQRKNKTLDVWQDDEKAQMCEASDCKNYSSQRFFGICDLPTDQECVAAMRGRYLVNGKRWDDPAGLKGKTQQYIEFRYDKKSNALTTVQKDGIVVPFTLPNRIPVDEFFFRYKTPIECERLQTMPDNFTKFGINEKGTVVEIPKTARYRALGNGWTAEVITHIFKCLKETCYGK